MRSGRKNQPPEFWTRLVMFIAGVVILALVYMFQRFNYAGLLAEFQPNVIFVINRTTRLVLNDLACLLLIYSIFRERRYLQIAFFVFLVELVVILPVYLAFKLTLEGDSEISSPLLSQIHRLIVNPMLMILLILGFFYQNLRGRKV